MLPDELLLTEVEAVVGWVSYFEDLPAVVLLLLVYRRRFPSGLEPAASMELCSLKPPQHLRPHISLCVVLQSVPVFPSSWKTSLCLLHSAQRQEVYPFGCSLSSSNLSLQTDFSSGFLSNWVQSRCAAGSAGYIRTLHLGQLLAGKGGSH